jgi:hypothetical protein
MESTTITAREADEVLQQWESLSLRVCFAVCMGDLAWHAQWVGTIRNAFPSRWVLVAGQTTNMLSTDQYKEIILTKDDELVGLRFLQPVGAMPGFEVNLFISKKDDAGRKRSAPAQQNHSVARPSLLLFVISNECETSAPPRGSRTEKSLCSFFPNVPTFNLLTFQRSPNP